jgi:hypothetical protein
MDYFTFRTISTVLVNSIINDRIIILKFDAPSSTSAVEERAAGLRNLLGELQDVLDDCRGQAEPLDVHGDSFRTAKSQSISTASCLEKHKAIQLLFLSSIYLFIIFFFI